MSVPGRRRARGPCCSSASARARSRACSAPAIHYAADGFPLTDIVCQAIRERFELFDDPEWRRIFVPGGVFPEPGDIFRQPDLARTLTELGDEPRPLLPAAGSRRAIAERLERDGFLTADDLAAHAGEWGEPISTTYRGYTVWETPPPTQGLATLLTLNLLEGFDVTAHPIHSVEHLHLLLEMTKLAYADRDRWVADPAAARLPVEQLLDKALCRAPARRLRPGQGAAPTRRARSTATPPASWSPTGAATSSR